MINHQNPNRALLKNILGIEIGLGKNAVRTCPGNLTTVRIVERHIITVKLTLSINDLEPGIREPGSFI